MKEVRHLKTTKNKRNELKTPSPANLTQCSYKLVAITCRFVSEFIPIICFHHFYYKAILNVVDVGYFNFARYNSIYGFSPERYRFIHHF